MLECILYELATNKKALSNDWTVYHAKSEILQASAIRSRSRPLQSSGQNFYLDRTGLSSEIDGLRLAWTGQSIQNLLDWTGLSVQSIWPGPASGSGFPNSVFQSHRLYVRLENSQSQPNRLNCQVNGCNGQNPIRRVDTKSLYI